MLRKRLPRMNHGSTDTHQRPKNSRNSGLHPANLLRGSQWLSYRPDGHRFAGIHMVIYIDYLENGKTVMARYYPELLGRYLGRIFLLLYYHQRTEHILAVTMAKLGELVYEVLPLLSYSLDLTPRHLFLNLKKSIEQK